MQDKRAKRIIHILNGLLDFVLLMAVYLCAGAVRVVTPYIGLFSPIDIWYNLPVGVLYAVIMTAVYGFQGGYRVLRVRGAAKEVVRVAVSNLISFALAATVLYVFKLSQFSRMLLAYYYLFSVIVIAVKRVLLKKAAERYIRSHDAATRVLLIGSGSLAHRFYEAVLKGQEEVKYVGYLARREVHGIPGYLGKERELTQILSEHEVGRIVIAQDIQRVEEIRHLVAVAESRNISVSIVPIYSDFLSFRLEEAADSGLYTINLKMSRTCDVMGVNIAVTNMARTMAMIEEKLEEWRGKYICVANVHTTVTSYDDQSYRKIQNNAVLALPDGGPLSDFSRKQGYTEARRVTGPDLMREILSISAEKGWRHYFYGSTTETLELLQQRIAERYPGVIIAGVMSPPFREMTPTEDEKAVNQINAAHPDFVWVGLGAPKQERWMAAHEDRVQALMIGVGAAFDYEAGNIRRAPQWMQKHNLEWLYRLFQDPKRLFRRYLNTNVRYLWWMWRR